MRIRKGSIGYRILVALEEVADAGVLEIFSYSAQMKYLRSLSNFSDAPTRKTLSTTVKRLRKNGLLEEKTRKDGVVMMKLSSLGREYLGIHELWDGKYRIVIWDIPENKRRLRDLLRRKLKEWQFRTLQKSVWVSKRNVTTKLRDLLVELGIEKWVVVIESDDRAIGDIKFHDRGRK